MRSKFERGDIDFQKLNFTGNGRSYIRWKKTEYPFYLLNMKENIWI